MGNYKIDSADYTNMRNTVTSYTVIDALPEELSYSFESWYKWRAYYNEVPEMQAVIDKKAMFTVGAGYKETQKLKVLDKWNGNGKDTALDIFNNAVKVYTAGGDFFAEIIKNSRGEIRNLKPLDPGTMKVILNKKGVITKYIQKITKADASGKIVEEERNFLPEKIFHLCWQRIGDDPHGTSTIKKMIDIIETRKEVVKNMRIVFNRYVKPIWVFAVETDDETEIADFTKKVDKAVDKGENLILPKDVLDKVDRISVPQYSTLDPLPFVKLLQEYFLMAEGVPDVILGYGRETTEASSKILYLAFEQMIKFNQSFLQKQIKAQLNLDIEFNFPASLLPELKEDNAKDGKPAAKISSGVKDD